MKICFLMPTYPPHFEYAIGFLKSYKQHKLNNQADVCLVFSNEKEEKDFEKLSNFKNYYSVVLPSNLMRKDIIIGAKKIYALGKIYQNYEYVIVIDSESLIIKNINLLKMCEEFYRNKTLYGNKLANSTTLPKRCLESCFCVENPERIDNGLYLWFNNLCIYKSEFIPHFFKLTKINEFSCQSIVFEYYVYMFYLLLYRGFKIEDMEVTGFWGFLEHGIFVPRSNKYLTLKPYHCCPILYPFLNTTNIFLFIQTDRKRDYKMFEPHLKHYRFESAASRIKQSLSYKLGSAILDATIFDCFVLPSKLMNIAKQHREITNRYEIYKILNPYLRLPRLQTYQDYQEGEKVLTTLNYKIGSALIKANSGGGGSSHL